MAAAPPFVAGGFRSSQRERVRMEERAAVTPASPAKDRLACDAAEPLGAGARARRFTHAHIAG